MNKAAQQTGRKARGVRKKFSREELQRRTERLKFARAARWKKTAKANAENPSAIVFPAPPAVTFNSRFMTTHAIRNDKSEAWKDGVAEDLNRLLRDIGSLDEQGEQPLRAATLRIVERVAEFESIERGQDAVTDTGDTGQDRKHYTDTQDRKHYTVR